MVYNGPNTFVASEKSKNYSWWNTVIRSEKNAIDVLVYRKHYFASRNQNFQYKGDIFFLESKTENTEQQDSVSASGVSSWSS